VAHFADYGIPIFLSEYGCIQNERNFHELESLMHPNMTGVYSGGLMYEYTMEDNKFGIVTVAGAKTDQTGDRAELPEYTAFVSAMSRFPAPTGTRSFKTASSATACPTKDDDWWIESTLLPKIPDGALKYMTDGAGEGPGLEGPGSQTAGTPSTGDAEPGSGATDGDKNAGTTTKASLILSSAAFAMTLMGALLL
jgi:hypothetical protein